MQNFFALTTRVDRARDEAIARRRGAKYAMSADTILVDDADGVRTITLNRPDKLNAFNADMHARAARGARAAPRAEATRAVLLTGAGKGFCAGPGSRRPRAGEGRARPPDLGQTIETLWNPLVRAIRGARKAGRLRRQRRRRPAPAPTSRSPAISCWPRARRIHPAVLPARPRAGRRRHLVSAAPRRRGARQGAGAARRAARRPSRPRPGA